MKYVKLSPAGYNMKGKPIFLNATVALERLGYHVPKTIGFTPSDRILETTWNTWAPRNFPNGHPTWEQLVQAQSEYSLGSLKSNAAEVLRLECRRRITLNYTNGASEDVAEEMFIRQLNEQTPEQDTERERLKAKYHEIRGMIDNSLTEIDITSIDYRGDAIWKP